ncbi:MAG TPA: carbohydrate ABC transporter permease, partial [Methylomirabilota bacterium]|nr:carbohydrate ABC transporter permease [Methylomirabilota bacterium]
MVSRRQALAPRALLARALLYLALLGVVAFSLFPIYFALTTSLKQTRDAFTMPPKWLFTPTLEHHYYIWAETLFPRYLLNTLIITTGAVLLSIPLGCMAAYYLARYRSRSIQILLFTLLAVRMFPRILLLVPFFLLARATELYDTHLLIVLIIVAFNQPFAIWLMRGFFLDVPRELSEAAMLDGCSSFGAFVRVVLPVVRPGLVTAALFTFLFAYNEFLYCLILTGSNAKPLSVAIAQYGAEKIEYWSWSAAGAVGILAPIVIFISLMQRHLIKGLTFG